MKTAIALLLLAMPFAGQARDILFNRLEKLHGKDQKKCLEAAQRYIELFPDNASAYYFSSIIYDERAGKSKTVQGKYRNLKKAIGYALTFEEKDDGTLALEVNWDDYRADLTENTKTVITQLEVANEVKYSNDLMSNLHKLDENVELIVEQRSDTEDLEIEEVEEIETVAVRPAEGVVVEANSTIRFFGLPKGNEMVKSANLEGEQELLALINEERIRQGMSPLEWEEDLARAARYHAYDLATQDYFDHQSYDRRDGKLVEVGDTFDRIRKFYDASFVNSENIAAGNESAKATYEQWFNSPGHYDNMFNKNSRKVGLGVVSDDKSSYGSYWVFCTAH